MFDEFILEEKELHGGIQKIYLFDNAYGASVVKHEFSYGGNRGLWELAVIQFLPDATWDLTYTSGITSDVEGCLTWGAVEKLLARIQSL